jgi:hypothetical protein
VFLGHIRTPYGPGHSEFWTVFCTVRFCARFDFWSVRGVILLHKYPNLERTWSTISEKFSSKKKVILIVKKTWDFLSLTDPKFYWISAAPILIFSCVENPFYHHRIKESTLNCLSKRLRKRLWAVLGGYRWRRSRLVSWCRARLPIIFCPSGDSSTHQRYINLVYNLCLVQFKSHTRYLRCFR